MTLTFPSVGKGCCLEDFWSSPIYDLTLSPRTMLTWTTSVTLPHFGPGLCSCDNPVCTAGRPLWGQVASGLGSQGLGPDETFPEAPWRDIEDQVPGHQRAWSRRAVLPGVDPQGLVAGWTLRLKEKWKLMTTPSLGLGRPGR